jgi:hypothetical protein
MINQNEMKLSNISETEPPVLDWDIIVHKNVRTKEYQAVGTIVAVDNNSIVVTSQGSRDEYSIPKSEVESFNGAEVFLKFTAMQLRRFKV